jgi:catechol 2,3-dioxygenase-like lactoylglutathione lyase family enzyme
VHVRGVVFVGTATAQRDQMFVFVRDILGLQHLDRPDVEADLFRLEDGVTFAIASPGGMGSTARSIGFLVDDLDSAVAELRSAGSQVDEPSANDAERYAHFVAPDGQLYELIERSNSD